jgi:hypothetical protein
VALAYVVGFAVMLAVLGWHADPPLRTKGAGPAAETSIPVSAPR